MRISDWSSDVCSSDLPVGVELLAKSPGAALHVEATRKHAFGPHSAIDTVHHHLDDAIEIIAQGGIRATRALVGADDLGDAEPMAVAQRQQLPARGERARRLHFLLIHGNTDENLTGNENRTSVV